MVVSWRSNNPAMQPCHSADAASSQDGGRARSTFPRHASRRQRLEPPCDGERALGPPGKHTVVVLADRRIRVIRHAPGQQPREPQEVAEQRQLELMEQIRRQVREAADAQIGAALTAFTERLDAKLAELNPQVKQPEPEPEPRPYEPEVPRPRPSYWTWFAL